MGRKGTEREKCREREEEREREGQVERSGKYKFTTTPLYKHYQ